MNLLYFCIPGCTKNNANHLCKYRSLPGVAGECIVHQWSWLHREWCNHLCEYTRAFLRIAGECFVLQRSWRTNTRLRAEWGHSEKSYNILEVLTLTLIPAWAFHNILSCMHVSISWVVKPVSWWSRSTKVLVGRPTDFLPWVGLRVTSSDIIFPSLFLQWPANCSFLLSWWLSWVGPHTTLY